MRKALGLMVGLLVLSGCALEPPTTVAAADTSDPACMSVATARARDAALNGYDTVAQTRIRDDSYRSCVAWAQKATTVEYGRR